VNLLILRFGVKLGFFVQTRTFIRRRGSFFTVGTDDSQIPA